MFHCIIYLTPIFWWWANLINQYFSNYYREKKLSVILGKMILKIKPQRYCLYIFIQIYLDQFINSLLFGAKSRHLKMVNYSRLIIIFLTLWLLKVWKVKNELFSLKKNLSWFSKKNHFHFRYDISHWWLQYTLWKPKNIVWC